MFQQNWVRDSFAWKDIEDKYEGSNKMTRDELRTYYTNTFETVMDQYDLEDIGVYEEEGPEQLYFMGYTIRKDGKVYHVHLPYEKRENGNLEVNKKEWTIQTDDGDEKKGLHSLDDVFSSIH